MELYRARCSYEKSGIAKFISNKNVQRLLERVLRRSGVSLKFTEGFSPRPKMSFGPPLPVNVEGTNEYFDFFLTGKFDAAGFMERVNGFLPAGIHMKTIRFISAGEPSITSRDIYGLYTIKGEGIKKDTVEDFGEITEQSSAKVRILIKVNNFSHKGMISLLLSRKVKSISREIIKN